MEGKIKVAWLWSCTYFYLFQQTKECSQNQKEKEFRRLNTRVLLSRSLDVREHKLKEQYITNEKKLRRKEWNRGGELRERYLVYIGCIVKKLKVHFVLKARNTLLKKDKNSSMTWISKNVSLALLAKTLSSGWEAVWQPGARGLKWSLFFRTILNLEPTV